MPLGLSWTPNEGGLLEPAPPGRLVPRIQGLGQRLSYAPRPWDPPSRAVGSTATELEALGPMMGP